MINQSLVHTRKIIIIMFTLFSMFLTFKYLISINLGFDIRIPHFLFGFFFFMLSLYITFKKKYLFFKDIWILILFIFIASVLNQSILNPYFTYLFSIILISYSIFAVLLYYNVKVERIAKIIVYASFAHIIASYTTFGQNWYGGFQMASYSDFPTFFAMQLSIIFPFIHFIRNKLLQYGIMILFIFTIFLLAARGPLLALAIGYLVLYRKIISFKQIVYIFLLAIILILIIGIFNHGLINYFSMKINPFADNYNMISDLNRWLYIVATVDYSFDGLNWLYGSGLKNNAYVVKSFFDNNFVNIYGEFNILDNATVHNIFLEIYSDLGIFVLLILLFVLHNFYKSFSKNDFKYNKYFKISLIVFIINYNLEPNYIHFFFWFFIFFYGYYAKYLTIVSQKGILR
jgi:hypothetical protein